MGDGGEERKKGRLLLLLRLEKEWGTEPEKADRYVSGGQVNKFIETSEGRSKERVTKIHKEPLSACVFQSSPLPPIEEFDPKNFLDQVEETDSAGNKIPEWKRQMKAKHLAQKAQEEYLEQKKVSIGMAADNCACRLMNLQLLHLQIDDLIATIDCNHCSYRLMTYLQPLIATTALAG